MQDLISRHDALECVSYDVEDTILRLEALPSAEHEIIRCKDCKNYEQEERPLTEDDYAYCVECDHVEMCRWYPMYGCEFKSRPSAEPEPHWISCSERLPESYVDVLVWFEYYRYGNYNRLYQTHGIGTYSENYDSWTINHESGWHKLRVIAWMPLPSPY